LWYRAPAEDLRQALSDPQHNKGFAWQVDIKAGWNHGVAPGARTRTGEYEIHSGDIDTPGRMPEWLTHEVIRVAGPRPPKPIELQQRRVAAPGPRPAAYLTKVINRGTSELVAMSDGRKRALSALAYKTGGFLAWSGLPHDQVADQLINAGIASGLPANIAHRIVGRAISRGIAEPLQPRPEVIRPAAKQAFSHKSNVERSMDR
jgi:hypothetical protein